MRLSLFLLLFLLFLCFLFLISFILLCLSLMVPFLATMSFAGYFLARFILPDFPPFFLRPSSRLNLISFRLSCDHDWIRSGSVDVR